jgi:hypothetical protein
VNQSTIQSIHQPTIQFAYLRKASSAEDCAFGSTQALVSPLLAHRQAGGTPPPLQLRQTPHHIMPCHAIDGSTDAETFNTTFILSSFFFLDKTVSGFVCTAAAAAVVASSSYCYHVSNINHSKGVLILTHTGRSLKLQQAAIWEFYVLRPHSLVTSTAVFWKDVGNVSY